MALLPTIANGVWFAASLREYHRFQRALCSPAEVQWAVLRRLLSRQAGTEFGRQYKLAGIRDYPEFASRIPLGDYDQAEPWIHRIRHGETNVLTRDPVLHLIPTSGSAGPCKLIPFTSELRSDFQRAIAPWIVDLFLQEPHVVRGPAYWSISPVLQMENLEASAVPAGFDDDSEYLGGARRRLVQCVMAAPSVLRFVQDPASFRYLTLLCLLQHRELRLLSVWHPSFLTLLLDDMPRHWEELLADLVKGDSRRCENLPKKVRQHLSFPSMRRRALELAEADPHCPETIWPGLRVISCWADGHAALAARDLAMRFPRTLIQPKGLLATEAIVTLPFQGRHPIAVNSHFYEFIARGGEVRRVHELQEGESYDVVVTTSGGLWRYRLNDRVKVNGCVGRTPSLSFMGRGGNVSDRFGEKLSEAFVGETLRLCLATLEPGPRFTMVAPESLNGVWRYCLFADVAVPEGVIRSLETGLRRNPHYDLCRRLGQLGELEAVQVGDDAYALYVSREMEHGRRLGDIKPVALSVRENWSGHFGTRSQGRLKDFRTDRISTWR